MDSEDSKRQKYVLIGLSRQFMQGQEKITHNSKIDLLILNGLNFTLRFLVIKPLNIQKEKSANYKKIKSNIRRKRQL